MGAEIRSKLQVIGILRESGHEHFNGSIVIPVFDQNGLITEVYGRKILGNRLRKGTAIHTYLPGPHQGVWNSQAVKASQEVTLCESLIKMQCAKLGIYSVHVPNHNRCTRRCQ